VEEPAPAEEPVPAEEPAPQETKPPFSEDMFGAVEETLPEPAFTIPAEKVALPGDLESMSLGALMAYARETVGFTPENVYDGTKINEKFLLAIEQDNFEKLPSGAFPGAYVRALCSFYHLEKNVCEIAQKKAAAYCTACRPPDEVYNSLPKHAVINKEEQEKFRRMITFAGIVILAIVTLVVVLLTVSAVKKNNAQNAVPVVSPVKMEELEQLDPASPQVITTELDVPR
jgi:cytoskeletal protein RodZ